MQTRSQRINISIKDVSKDYGSLSTLRDISINIDAGRIAAVVGPSGCGKSTLILMVAGLIEPTRGLIRLGGGDPRSLRASGAVGIVFQDEALLPWRTVAGNVTLPLDLLPDARRRPFVDTAELLSLVGLRAFAEAYPRQLSGGMRRRLSIARALVTRPSVLLLDEPFGALDEPLRRRLMIELEGLWLKNTTTALLVTHSITEAVFLSDFIVVLSARPGHIIRTLKVETPRPRSDAFLRSRGFQDLCEAVMEVFPVAD